VVQAIQHGAFLGYTHLNEDPTEGQANVTLRSTPPYPDKNFRRTSKEIFDFRSGRKGILRQVREKAEQRATVVPAAE
jgi:hypothetical protein